jgi:hypothetical protein
MPAAVGRSAGARRQNGPVQLPGFWIVMQILIVICVLISAVIVIVKL